MRLFVAVDVPGEIKNSMGALCAGLAGARWVKPEQMHLTLRFIGETEKNIFDDVKRALGAIEADSFGMRLRGLGQFPPNKPPRVLWVGVDAPAALAQLVKQVEKTVVAQGFAPEDKPFSPHITLARLKSPPAPDAVRAYFSKHEGFQSEPFPVTEFVLYSSVLSPGGSIYTREAVYALKRTE